MSLNEPQKFYVAEELIAFYCRVEPVLSDWLVKPVWTAKQTAMLCAGFAPNACMVDSRTTATNSDDLVINGSPMDPEGYLPANSALYGNLFRRLCRLGADAAPLEMMKRLGVSRGISKGSAGIRIELKALLGLEVIDELQWLFIVGNAVGLRLPAIVPFGLVKALLAACDQEHASILQKRRDNRPLRSIEDEDVKEGRGQLHAVESVLSGTLASVKERHNGKDGRYDQVLREQRDFYTTEEVALLTNLRPQTLTKYARQLRPIAGFSPYKPEGTKAWRWRAEPHRPAVEADSIDSK